MFYNWEFDVSTQLAMCSGVLSKSADITSMIGFVWYLPADLASVAAGNYQKKYLLTITSLAWNMKPIYSYIHMLIVHESLEPGQTFSIMFSAGLFELIILSFSLFLPTVVSNLPNWVNGSRKADNLDSSGTPCMSFT